MSDIVDNNSSFNPQNLGTISYNSNGVSSNIYDFDSVGLSDSEDWFTVNTSGLNEVRVDIHPTGLTGDYYYEFMYMIANYDTMSTTYVIMIGDGGSYDGHQDSRIDSYINYGYTPYNGDSDYLIFNDQNALSARTSYLIIEDTFFNAEFDPHLIVTPDSSGVITIMVESSLTTASGREETSYVLDISPRSATATSAESHLATFGVSLEQASDFIFDNVSNLQLVHDICLQFGVTNDMIADILDEYIPNIDGTFVANYFVSNGVDSSDLSPSSPTVDLFIA